MSDLSYATPARFSPLGLQARPAHIKAAAVLLGTLVLAIASQISVPMVPVPMTMQTLAVILIGALYGWRLGALTILAWLGEAALGLPVLAGGNGGLAPFMGPTGGYLVSFPFVAAWSAGSPSAAGTAAARPSPSRRCCSATRFAWLSAGSGSRR
jgi:biotin transport system substrate-specific component